jgi:hypothetical protein
MKTKTKWVVHSIDPGRTVPEFVFVSINDVGFAVKSNAEVTSPFRSSPSYLDLVTAPASAGTFEDESSETEAKLKLRRADIFPLHFYTVPLPFFRPILILAQISQNPISLAPQPSGREEVQKVFDLE